MNWNVLLKMARWLLAIAAVIYAYWLGSQGVEITEKTPGEISGVVPILKGVGMLVVGIALVAPELIAILSAPLQHFLGGIFFPGESGPPPPDYNRSKVYREQGRYEEAIAHYHSIIEHHPQELLAYIEGVQSAYLNGTPEEAQKFYQIALRKLDAEVAREQVRKAVENPPEIPDEIEEEEAVASAGVTGEEDLPPWRQPGAETAAATAGSDEDELPPWRRAEAPETVASTQEDDDIPPWLREVKQAEAAPTAEGEANPPQPPPPATEDDAPPWRS